MPSIRNARHRCISAVLAVCLAAAVPVPAVAQSGGPVTQRRVLGVVFLGSCAVLAKRSYDLHSDADRLYELYVTAETTADATRLFDETQSRDTKSQITGALSVVMFIAGARLLLSRGADDKIPELDRGLRVGNDLSLDVRGDAPSGRLDVRLSRGF